jgi:hypothetical protein
MVQDSWQAFGRSGWQAVPASFIVISSLCELGDEGWEERDEIQTVPVTQPSVVALIFSDI